MTQHDSGESVGTPSDMASRWYRSDDATPLDTHQVLVFDPFDEGGERPEGGFDGARWKTTGSEQTITKMVVQGVVTHLG